jgi:hypothetical protein
VEGREHSRRRHWLLRVATAALLSVAASAVTTSQAVADTIGVAYTDGGGIEHGAGVDIQATPAKSSGSREQCTYTPLPVSPNEALVDVNGASVGGDGTGVWYEKVCANGTDYWGAVYVRPQQVDPAELAAEARRRLALPAPVPRFSPADQQIVNVPTWMSIDSSSGQPLQSSVSVPGVVVTVTALPTEVVWDMGDGARVVCHSGGDAPSCSHTYRWPSAGQPDFAYRVTATVTWHATWTVTGAAGGGDLGTLSRSVTVPVRVGELQALNT